MKRILTSPICVAFAIMLPALTGCVPYQIKFQSHENLDAYRKVYVGYMKKDPMLMQSIISARLTAAGFDVVDLDP